MSLRDYLGELEERLHSFDDYGLSDRIDYSADIRSGAQASVRATVLFVDASELYLREFLIEQGQIRHVSYAYQYQKEDGQLIFRYDNARHRPTLGFEQHRHGASIVLPLPNVLLSRL
jgi:hypothetical protein